MLLFHTQKIKNAPIRQRKIRFSSTLMNSQLGFLDLPLAVLATEILSKLSLPSLLRLEQVNRRLRELCRQEYETRFKKQGFPLVEAISQKNYLLSKNFQRCFQCRSKTSILHIFRGLGIRLCLTCTRNPMSRFRMISATMANQIFHLKKEQIEHLYSHTHSNVYRTICHYYFVEELQLVAEIYKEQISKTKERSAKRRKTIENRIKEREKLAAEVFGSEELLAYAKDFFMYEQYIRNNNDEIKLEEIRQFVVHTQALFQNFNVKALIEDKYLRIASLFQKMELHSALYPLSRAWYKYLRWLDPLKPRDYECFYLYLHDILDSQTEQVKTMIWEQFYKDIL